MRQVNKQRNAGFSLIEILIAMFILAMVSIASYETLNQATNAKIKVTESLDSMAQLQKMLLMLTTDLSAVRHRPIRGSYGDGLASLTSNAAGEYFLEFSRGGVRRPAALEGNFSNLQRIAYGIEEERLWRYRWDVLDRAQDAEAKATPLMKGVTGIDLRFFDADMNESQRWPPQRRDEEREPHQIPPPAGVEITLQTEQWGEIRKLFLIGNGLDAASLAPVAQTADSANTDSPTQEDRDDGLTGGNPNIPDGSGSPNDQRVNSNRNPNAGARPPVQ